MDSFDRLRALQHHIYHVNTGFKRWFIELKRCYPWPEWVLAELIGIDLAQMYRWRNGRGRVSPRTLLHIGHVIGFRIGAWQTGRDLLRTKKLMATGELERMIDAFLAKEAQAIAAGKARAEARKRAKSVTKQDTEPPKPVE